jgi:chitinase
MGYEHRLYPPAELNFSLITHLVVGRVLPTASGTLIQRFEFGAPDDLAVARAIGVRAHAAQRKVLLMVGGAGTHPEFRAAIAPDARAEFADSLLALVDRLGYDGVDIDFEPIEDGDKEPLLAFLSLLRARRPAMLITMPVGWVNTNAASTPDPWYAQAAAVVDQMNTMTYDMAGLYPGWEVWHHGPLYGDAVSRPSSIASTIQFYRSAGVPAERLGVGLGTYGSCWRGVFAPRESPGAGVTLGDNDRRMTYDTIMTRYDQAGSRRWDDSAQVPYLTFRAPRGPQGCNFISYEDPRSAAAKAEYVRAQGLGGIMIWTAGQGHSAHLPRRRRDPLLRAVFRVLSRS